MAAYLKIENPGEAPSEAFTLLGASTKRGRNDATIGKFGSGGKHGVAVLLRHDLGPTVFSGNLRMTFGTRAQPVSDGLGVNTFNRVVVKFGGKDSAGVNRSSTEDLGYVLEYGSDDWTGVDLALREFVSNAIDRAMEQGLYDFSVKWLVDNNFPLNNDLSSEDKDRLRAALTEYRKTARDYRNVVVEVVNENQVRAKAGYTRVFVPLNQDVFKFYENLGKWFLHFSEPESLGKTILPKKSRNLTDRKAAVIYRKGVRVREFESDDVPSLFDYNLDNLEMDEARKVDDWKVKYAAGRAVRDAGEEVFGAVLESFMTGREYWEHGFESYSLDPGHGDLPETVEARTKVWGETFVKVAGPEAVIAVAGTGQLAVRKGYKVVTAPEPFVRAGAKYGVKTILSVFSLDDREGREILDPTPDAVAAVDWVWSVIQEVGMTNGKEKPAVKSFRQIMQAESQTLGFYRDGTVYFNTDICGEASVAAGLAGLSRQLVVTAIEEIAHWVTGATDNSRDFQDYAFNLAGALMMKG